MNDNLIDLKTHMWDIEEENKKLKKLLKLAVKDIDFLGTYFDCAGCSGLKPDWSDKKADWHDCPFASNNKNECLENWRHADEVAELAGL